MMNNKKLTYDEFFQFIWDDSNLSKTVSVAYQNEEEEYVRSLTYDIFRLYEKSDMTEKVALKILEVNFFNLFRFQPRNRNIKEIQDNYNDF